MMLRRGVRNRRNTGASSVAPISAPTGLPGLGLWLRADLGVTTGATFTWADQSGNAVNYTQSTGTNQPAQTAGAGPLGGSQPAIVFTGANLQQLVNASTAVIGAQNWTVYMVLKFTSTASAQLAMNFGNTGVGGWGFGIGVLGSSLRTYTALSGGTGTFGTGSTNFEKWTLQSNAGTILTRVNGAGVTNSGSPTASAPPASSAIGLLAAATDPMDGSFWEIAAYNAVHSAVQIQQYEAYQHAQTGL